MPTATNLLALQPKGGDPAPGSAPGAGDLFAALMAGAAPETKAGTSDADSEALAIASPEEEDIEAVAMDAALLLPMIDQQRAITPASVALPGGGCSSEINVVGAPSKAVVATGRATPEITAGDPSASGPAGPAEPDGATTNSAAILRVSADDAPVDGALPLLPTAPTAKPAETTATATATATAPLADLARPLAATDVPQAVPAADAKDAARQATVAPPADPARPVAATDVPQVALPIDPVSAKPTAKATASAPATTISEEPTAAAVRVAPAIAEAAPQRPLKSARIVDKAVGDMAVTKASEAAPAPSQPVVQPVVDAALGAQSPRPALAPQAPVQTVAAQIAEQVLDMSKGGAWIDQLARDISSSASKDGVMRFALTPESLGELKVEISHSDRGAHIRMHVGSEAAQQALADASARLTSEARAQGVRIAETEITLAGGQAQQHAQDQGRETGRQSDPGQARHADAHSNRMTRGGSAASTINEGAIPAGRTDRYA